MKTPRWIGARPATVSLALVVLGACGGGSEGTTAKVAQPAVYVREVCRVMVRWSQEVTSAFDATDLEPDDFASPAGIRSGLLSYFDPLQDVTDDMRERVDEAGHPDVADGVGIARGLRDQLSTASARLKANRDGWAATPLSDVQPAASIEGALTATGEQQDAVHAAVERLGERVPELRQAREREPACIEFEKMGTGTSPG